ncbi:unnamed protein product [Timema podura]|uniref:Uncharacterized protein n=1 Tax=Timema podura TaxID=61482 RepID=A0ABN7PHV7_TIMPD|nr:unnamed protein product [Timema podura]
MTVFILVAQVLHWYQLL